MSTAAERVAKGAALLDERVPGWWDRVDSKSLDIGDGCNCVLGQLFGGYVDGFVHLDLTYLARQDHAFTGYLGEIVALQAEWSRVIAERQAGTP